jgi:AcrR family transcriptional regulator
MMTLPGRARTDESKQARRQTILDATAELFETTAYDAIVMQVVADRVQLAKGTLYLYFPTKDALFLALLEAQFVAWFSAVDCRLVALEPNGDAATLASVLAEEVATRPTLVRLVGLLHRVLEENIDPPTAVAFRRWLLARQQATGGGIERAWPALMSGDGLRLLLRLHALMIGLGALAEPSLAVRQALWEPDLRPMLIDFAAELEATLRDLLHGMAPR